MRHWACGKSANRAVIDEVLELAPMRQWGCDPCVTGNVMNESIRVSFVSQ